MWDIQDGDTAGRITPIDASSDRVIQGLNGNLYFQNPHAVNSETFVCQALNPISGRAEFGYIGVTVEPGQLC